MEIKSKNNYKTVFSRQSLRKRGGKLLRTLLSDKCFILFFVTVGDANTVSDPFMTQFTQKLRKVKRWLFFFDIVA